MWDQVGHTLSESTTSVLSRLASLLPGMLALLVAVLFSVALAWLVAFILRRFLRGVQFDKQLEAWGFSSLAEFSPEQSPTLLVTRVGLRLEIPGSTLDHSNPGSTDGRRQHSDVRPA